MSPEEQRALWDGYAGTDLATTVVSGYPSAEEGRAAAARSAGRLLRRLGITTSDTVLDIGPGLCFHGVRLAPKCKRWIGVDVAGALLQSGWSQRGDISNMTIVANNGYDLADIESGSVSVVYSLSLFLHLEPWQRYSYLQESFRVLGPGGRVYVESFGLESEAGWALFEKITGLFREEPHSRLPIRPSTKAELRQYLVRCGFQSVRCSVHGATVTACAVKPDAANISRSANTRVP